MYSLCSLVLRAVIAGHNGCKEMQDHDPTCTPLCHQAQGPNLMKKDVGYVKIEKK